MFENLTSTKGLSHERLQALILLGDSGSLIAAAGGDSGLQSRLSHRIRELSEFFGTELTTKAGKSIKLTSAGEALVQIARDHFLSLQAFRDQAASAVVTYRIAAADNLAQWLVVPTIGSLRRRSSPMRLTLVNLRTKESVEQLKERRVEFGVLRSDAVESPLRKEQICEQQYAIFVPRRLTPSRGLLSIRDALLGCPHAALGGDGQLMEQVRGLAKKLGGTFSPELTCASIGQCVAAVQTGSFAAVLPVHAWPASAGQEYTVVEDAALLTLSRKIVLAWHPRTLEVLGASGRKMQRTFCDELKKALADGPGA